MYSVHYFWYYPRILHYLSAADRLNSFGGVTEWWGINHCMGV